MLLLCFPIIAMLQLCWSFISTGQYEYIFFSNILLYIHFYLLQVATYPLYTASDFEIY